MISPPVLQKQNAFCYPISDDIMNLSLDEVEVDTDELVYRCVPSNLFLEGTKPVKKIDKECEVFTDVPTLIKSNTI